MYKFEAKNIHYRATFTDYVDYKTQFWTNWVINATGLFFGGVRKYSQQYNGIYHPSYYCSGFTPSSKGCVVVDYSQKSPCLQRLNCTEKLATMCSDKIE